MWMGKVYSFIKDENILVFNVSGGIVEISFPEDDIIRIRFTEKSSFTDEENFILAAKPGRREFQISEGNGFIELCNPRIKAIINLDPFNIRILDGCGKEILSSADNFISCSSKDKTVRLRLQTDEKIYGLGQDPMGNLDQRDKERRMWQQWGSNKRSGNAGIPFMMSSNGYGILLNSSWSSRFCIGRAEVADSSRMGDIMAPAPWGWDASPETDKDKTSIIVDGGDLDLFIICCSNFDSILEEYGNLTGFAPMLPKWAYGFMQCRNRYRSQEELLKTAKALRDKKIPCDVLIIDWLWFTEFGDLKWDEKNWPDPDGMYRELEKMGFKVMSAQHPFISEKSVNFKSFKEKGFLNKVPEGKRQTFDHSNPEAREAWWNYIRPIHEQGLAGY
jgi:alpha-glucosidase (family GH31 glycosyl hydrolase)